MKKKILIIGAIVIVAAIAVSVYFLCCQKSKPAGEEKVKDDTLVAPLTDATSFITEETDTSLTVEGIICTPLDNENAPIMDIDDPDYDPIAVSEYQMIHNVFDSYEYKTANGSGYLTIKYETTSDDDKSSSFKVVLDENQIKDIDDLYIVCDDVETRIWEK